MSDSRRTRKLAQKVHNIEAARSYTIQASIRKVRIYIRVIRFALRLERNDRRNDKIARPSSRSAAAPAADTTARLWATNRKMQATTSDADGRKSQGERLIFGGETVRFAESSRFKSSKSTISEGTAMRRSGWQPRIVLVQPEMERRRLHGPPVPLFCWTPDYTARLLTANHRAAASALSWGTVLKAIAAAGAAL
jgi:hypothetical protein